ncbi:hypothetical protein FOA52_009880 [Chlamydomonas sp. UWO 241]|nr:hypothetical protein FOA52_009880 [Chlamydomonas sp. UWO 241]
MGPAVVPGVRLPGGASVPWSCLQDGVRVAAAALVGVAAEQITRGHLDLSNTWQESVGELLYWSAITVVSVSTPLMGKTAQIGVQRIIGTIIGGALGLGLAMTFRPSVVIVGLVALSIAATTLASVYKMDYAGKLCIVTYVIVVCAGNGLTTAREIQIMATMRVFGILSGVLLMFIASVLIFPRAAAEEAMTNMRDAVKALAQLHDASWEALDDHRRIEQGTGDKPAAPSDAAKKCEDAFVAFAKAARSVEDNLAISGEEMFVGVAYGHRVIVPAWLAGLVAHTLQLLTIIVPRARSCCAPPHCCGTRVTGGTRGSQGGGTSMTGGARGSQGGGVAGKAARARASGDGARASGDGTRASGGGGGSAARAPAASAASVSASAARRRRRASRSWLAQCPPTGRAARVARAGRRRRLRWGRGPRAHCVRGARAGQVHARARRQRGRVCRRCRLLSLLLP